MKKKKKAGLVPELRFPEFEDAGEWELDCLNRLVEIIDGDRGQNYPSLDEFSSSGYCLFLNAKNVTKNGFRFDDVQFITQKKDIILKKGKLQRSDIILTTRGTVGQSAFYSEDVPYDNIRINSGMVILRVKSKKIKPSYFFTFCKTNQIATHMENISFGNAQQQLTVAIIKNIPVVYPNIEEQQRIADCLSSLDQLITAHTQKLDALKLHKKGLMQRLFPAEGENVPQLRFPEFKDAGEWLSKSLFMLCDMQAGKFVQATQIYEKRKKNMYPCYGGNGLRGYTYSFTHSGEYPLIGRQGALCGNVTYATGAFHATEHAIVTTKKHNVNAKWLYFLIIKMNLNQYATGQAQPGISVQTLEKLWVYVPSLPEQQRIADCLSSLDELIDAQAKKLEALKLHKKGLMQGLFPAAEEVAG